MRVNSFTAFKILSVQPEKIFFFFCLFLTLVLSHLPAFGNEILRFGWYPGDPLSMNEDRARAFTKYLSDRSGLHIEAVNQGNLTQLIDSLKEDKVQLASLPNYQYPPLHANLHLLATPQYNSSGTMYLYIIANAAAGINTLDQLKGKPAAQFIENNKLKCYFLSESLKANPQEFLGKVAVFQNLRDAVEDVATGKSFTTCLSSVAYEVLIKFDPSLKTRIKIIKRSPAYAMDPMVATNQLPNAVWWNIQSILINMSHDYAAQQILLSMGFHGFINPVTELSSYPSPIEQKKNIALITADKEKENKSKIIAAISAEPVDSSSWGPASNEKEAVTENLSSPKQPGAGTAAVLPPTEAVTKPTDTPAPASPATTVAKEEMPVEHIGGQITGQVGKSDSAPVATGPTAQSSTKTTPDKQPEIIPNKEPGTRPARSLFLKNQFLIGAIVVILLIIVGLIACNMLANMRKGKVVTVVLMMNKRLTALQSSLDWRGKLHIKSCRTGNSLEKYSARKLLKDIGHKSSMKLVAILNSDRIIFKEFTFPLLAEGEIRPAIHWKLKDMNIPYDEEKDAIHYTVIARDRKKKEISVQAMLLSADDTNRQNWAGIDLTSDSVMCMEMALLNRLRHCLKPDVAGNTILAYRLNEEEALLLILARDNTFISRRIYGTSTRTDIDLPSFSLEMEHKEPTPAAIPPVSMNPTEMWKNFLPDIRQTISFHCRQSGSDLDTLYLAGPGVPSEPDPENYLADQLAMKIEFINLLADVELAAGTEKDCPAVEILAGAAMLWHQKA